MTAVNWLEQQIKDTFYVAEASEMAKRFEGIFEQAKEMEKQQIIDAYSNGSNDRLRNTINDYYNETYGSKGSETTSSQTESVKNQVIKILNDIDYRYELKGDADWLMNEILDRLENMPTSSQTEISDEEIEQYAKRNAFQYYEFITGAKWYREQLKQKQ